MRDPSNHNEKTNHVTFKENTQVDSPPTQDGAEDWQIEINDEVQELPKINIPLKQTPTSRLSSSSASSPYGPTKSDGSLVSDGSSMSDGSSWSHGLSRFDGSSKFDSGNDTPLSTPATGPLIGEVPKPQYISERLYKEFLAKSEPVHIRLDITCKNLEDYGNNSGSSDGTPGIRTPDGKTLEDFQPTVGDVIKRIRRPKYPIQVHDGPPVAMTEGQHRRIMRWRYKDCSEHPWIVWLQSPNLQRIEKVAAPYVKRLFPEVEEIEVEFLAAGGYNKVYTLTAKSETTQQYRTYIFRVAAPVYPYYKVESEVATMELVRSSTSIPIPVVYAYDSNWNNELGFEWILMESMNGNPDWYDEMDWDTKLRLTKTVALWTSQLAQIRVHKIGSIFMRCHGSNMEYYVGRSVASFFFTDRNIWYDGDRGPFDTLERYYRAILALQRFEATQAESITQVTKCEEPEVAKNDDAPTRTIDGELILPLTEEEFYEQADRDDAEFRNWRGGGSDYYQGILEIIHNYEEALPYLLDTARHEPAPFVASPHHHDMSVLNIFVDQSGKPTALLDWEHIYLTPPYTRYLYPKFLQNPYMNGPPQEKFYKLDTEKGQKEYKEDMEEYQKLLLGKEFKAEIERLNPTLAEEAWSERYEYWAEFCQQVCNIQVMASHWDDWLEEQLEEDREGDADEDEEGDVDLDVDEVMTDVNRKEDEEYAP